MFAAPWRCFGTAVQQQLELKLPPRQYRSLAAALLIALIIGLFGPLARDTHALPDPLSASADLSKVDAMLQSEMTSDPLKLWPIIVQMRPQSAPFPAKPNEVLAQNSLALIGRYGKPVGGLALIGAAAGAANAAGIASISLNPQVAYVSADATVRPTSMGASGAGAPIDAYPTAVNAVSVWLRGGTGAGATVAVLDSGINRDPDLTVPRDRVLTAVNFGGALNGMADAGGHGTHVAGTIAGDGNRSNGAFVGIAPQANVVDVRVLNSTGAGRISSVVRGIEWVLAHRAEFNIRVINLSLGMPARTPYRLDPLCAAVEIAWMHGVAVVAAAGNAGPQSGTVDSPGVDPYVITVGATDDQGTPSVADDELSSFSAWGTPTGSTAKPDVVAPGRRIVSLRVPGSYLDRLFPGRVTSAPNGTQYFRLSGTSMATAVVSGTTSLLLQQQPGLTPDQIKDILSATTQRYGWASNRTAPSAAADGRGLIDALQGTYAPPVARASRNYRPADTFARAVYSLVYGSPLVWKDPHFANLDWATVTWANLAWDNLAWDNLAWDNLGWDNLAWDNLGWDNLAWDNLMWDNLAWDNLGWDEAKLD